MTEATTPDSRSFQPTMDRVPSNSLDPSDGGLVQTFNTEGGDLIKGASPVLESMIRCPDCRAERLPASRATVATALSPSSRVEAMANDGSGVTSS